MGIGGYLLNNKCSIFSEEEENEDDDMETSDNEGRPTAEGPNAAARANPADEFNFDAYDDEGKFSISKIVFKKPKQ